VARCTGTSDTATLYYVPLDLNYLTSCGAVVNDWSYPGDHYASVPSATLTAALTWLVNQRIPAGANDYTNALTLATNWQARVTAGQSQAVLYECVSNLMNFPRSWYAYQSQLMLDQLLTNNATFRSLAVSNLAAGDFAADLFYYYARGAATNSDQKRYFSALKALTGVTDTSGDRAGDIYTLLKQSGYPAPILNGTVDAGAGQSRLWINEDAPGLGYTLQLRTNLVNAAWQVAPASTVDADTIWSAILSLDPTTTAGFFRVLTAPTPGTSPPWPTN
jgi:hypothetical protein